MHDIVYIAPMDSCIASESVRAWETYEDAWQAVKDWFEFYNLEHDEGDEDKYIVPVANGGRYPLFGKVPAEVYY